MPRLRMLLPALLAAGIAGAPARGDDEDGKKPETAAPIEVPVLVGRGAKDLRLPSFDEEGRREMIMAMEVATRISENEMKMTAATIDFFEAEKDEKEMTVEMPDSVLDLQTRVITSGGPVHIRRKEFEMRGDSMEFDTQSRRGKLKGNIRMLIYDREKSIGS